MTIAELGRMSKEEQESLFDKMGEPLFQRAINTESVSLDKIIDDFMNCNVCKKDREILQNDLVNLV